jgi:hypothetical protein
MKMNIETKTRGPAGHFIQPQTSGISVSGISGIRPLNFGDFEAPLTAPKNVT